MPVELSDAEVFGTAPVKELSDAEVFGRREMSDADVFGKQAGQALSLGEPALITEADKANLAAFDRVVADTNSKPAQEFDAPRTITGALKEGFEIANERVGIKAINTPILEASPTGGRFLGFSSQDPEKIAEVNRIKTSGLPEEKVALGLREGADEFLSGLTTPLSIGTIGIAGLLKGAPAVSRALSAWFAVHTGKSLAVDTAKALGEEYGKPEEQRDQSKISRLWTGAALNAPLTAALGAHALRGEASPLITPKETGPTRAEYLSTLGLEPDATPADIKSAFRDLAKQHHPDVAGNTAEANAQFQDILDAYTALTPPKPQTASEPEAPKSPEVKLAEENNLPATAEVLKEVNSRWSKEKEIEKDVLGAPGAAEVKAAAPVTESVAIGSKSVVPVHEKADSITKQLEVTADPASTKAVTLVTPGSPMPEDLRGLVPIPVGDHGTAMMNPAKTTREAVLADAEGKDFDGTLLGMSQSAKPEPVGNTVVQTTKDGVPVLDEVVPPTEEAIAQATAAHASAVPGGETTIVPAEKVLEERKSNTNIGRFEDREEIKAKPTGITELDALTKKWEGQGVKLHLGVNESGAISLDLIDVPEVYRNQGIGSQVLTELKAAADKLGKPIELIPLFKNDPRLEKFYQRQGFAPFDRGAKKMPGFRYAPKTPTRSAAETTSPAGTLPAPTSDVAGKPAPVAGEVGGADVPKEVVLPKPPKGISVSPEQWNAMAKLNRAQQLEKYGTTRALLMEEAATKTPGTQRESGRVVSRSAEASPKSSESVEEITENARRNIESLPKERRELVENFMHDNPRTKGSAGFIALQKELDALDERARSGGITAEDWGKHIYFQAPNTLLRWGHPEERPLTRQEAQILNDHKAQVDTTNKLRDQKKDWPTVKSGDFPTQDQAESLTGEFDEGRRPGRGLWGERRMQQYDMLRQQGHAAEAKPKPETPISMGGQNPRDPGEIQKAQLAQLTDAVSSLGDSGKPEVGKAFDLGASIAGVKESIAGALDGLRAAGMVMKRVLEGKPVVTDWKRMLGDRHLALSESAINARKWMKAVVKGIPNVRTREAITNWVDAGGDEELLKVAAAETKERYRAGYERALQLTPEEKTVAENLRNYFESRLQEAIDAGILEDGIENYIHRIYEQDSPWKQGVIAELRSGIFTGRPALAKQRVFEYDYEAEKAGKRPIKDFAKRVVAYDLALNKAIADRAAVKAMMEIKMPDGRPMIDVGGGGTVLKNEDGTKDATLINRSAKRISDDEKENRGDFKSYDHPALRKWKWVTNDAEGKPIFVQGDVLVHPEAMKQVKVLFDRSAVRQNPVGNLALNASGVIKQTMLDLSLFHQVQIGIHGMEHRTFKPVSEIDFTDPDVRGLIRGGAVVGETSGRELFSEGLSGSSLTKHIPWVGARIQAYQEYLFGDFIPRLKVAMGLHALERNRERFSNLTAEQHYQMTASQMNAAFGALNWEMMGVSKTTQDALRLGLLAPDFLLARAKFVGQGATLYGGIPHARNGKFTMGEQGTALLLGAVTMYILARIINKLLNDEYHFEGKNAFNVLYHGRSYGVRTVQGDLIHLVTEPGKFVNHRLNPVYAKPALEFATGFDYFGRKRNTVEKLKDFALTPIPISLRGLASGQEQTLADSLLNSVGAVVKRDSPSSDMAQLAQEWKEKNKIKGVPGEFRYDAEKDPYRNIKLAAERGDEATARSEIEKAMQGGMKRQDVQKHFLLAEQHLFAGSRKNEHVFFASLTEDQKKIYADAQAERKRIREVVLRALR